MKWILIEKRGKRKVSSQDNQFFNAKYLLFLGVLSLSAAYEQTPDFVDDQGAADVTRQLTEANAMLNMLKANHFKLLSARSDISNLPSPDSPYSEYIQVRKDKQVSYIICPFCVSIYLSILYICYHLSILFIRDIHLSRIKQ